MTAPSQNSPTRIWKIRKMVKRFTKICRRSLARLDGMTSVAASTLKSIPQVGKSGNSAIFVQDFGRGSARHFLLVHEEPA